MICRIRLAHYARPSDTSETFGLEHHVILDDWLVRSLLQRPPTTGSSVTSSPVP